MATVKEKTKTKTETLNIEINGRKHAAKKGQTILDVAAEIGIDIPTLCHDPRIKPYGSCRVCLVEVEGARGPLVACATEVADEMKINTETDAIKELRKLSLELLISNHWADCIAPCVKACPAETDAQGYIGLINQGRYHEAVKLIKETNPFPAIIGRVCTRPCEDACRRNLVDEKVSICWLKRFVGDFDLNSENRYRPQKAKDSGKKVAVIGSGPAGLSCAYYSAINGHDVTVFEAKPEAGGMLYYGIPAYRLPKDLLDKEISTVTELGVDIQKNKALGDDFTMESLQKDYDAVFLGIGAQVASKMGIEGEDLDGVLGGVDILREIGLNKKPEVGRKVAVIGGGNSAIDTARSSVRLGAKEVTLIYRRSRNEMPAHEIEIKEAEEEGVKLKLLTNPSRFLGKNGKVNGLECVRMELGEPDESGRRRPSPVKGSEFKIEADMVIVAIGQNIEVEKTGVKSTERNRIQIDNNTLQTSIPNVFAGGDAVVGPDTAIGAIAAGRRASIAINQHLAGEKIKLEDKSFSAEKFGISKEDFKDEPKAKSVKMPDIKVSERKGFKEVEEGYSEKEALKEAKRCLECGCIKQNDCDLRDLSQEYGVDATRFEGGEMLHFDIDARHPFVKQD
ncbi:MAG: 2Fe-2S iron-sulfur cluster binding domain-containing protein, partial [Actinobacteria bacterium]